TTKRPHTLESYLKIVHEAHQLGFKIVSYQILGLPNESLESMIQTLAFNARLPVLLGASPFYLTPASPIARGLDLTVEDYVKARLTAIAIETDQFRREIFIPCLLPHVSSIFSRAWVFQRPLTWMH